MDPAVIARMTNAEVEAKGVEWALEFFACHGTAADGVFDTHETRRPAVWQRLVGDFFVRWKDGKYAAVEVKTERRHTGKLFLEVWSNLCTDLSLRRPGWMETGEYDTLLYTFLDQEVTYSIPFQELRGWAEGKAAMYDWEVRPAGMSSRGEQKNLTKGHPVPVWAIRKGVAVKTYHRAPGGVWTLGRPTLLPFREQA